MQLPKIENPKKYIGLYVIDFGPTSGVGYTTDEVACLLETEQYSGAKVYKIHRAGPDGSMELAGVPRERFFLESGMFFCCLDQKNGQKDYQKLLAWSKKEQPPCRAKLQLAKYADDPPVIALIYPAEYEQEIGYWLRDSGFVGSGPVDAGVSQVQRFYQQGYDILASEQLWPMESLRAREKEELLAAVGKALQR